jgi:ADP-heptose:LPS heptosyltransferase
LRDQYAAGMYHDLTRGLKNYLQQDKTAPLPETSPAQKTPGAAQIPQIIVKEEAREAMQKLIEVADTAGSAKVKIVLIHPGTSTMAVQKGIIKTWPGDNWLTLIQKLCQISDLPFALRVILAGGPDDKEVIADLEAKLDKSPQGRPQNFQSFAGKTRGLSDLAALIELSDVIVCVDSAPMHLAVGLNKKIVALFGPTDPEKLIPNGPGFKVLADRKSSPTSPPRSLLDGLGVRLQPDIVYQSLLDLLKAE